MLFNSSEFAVFIVIVFVFYWFVTCKSLRLQNLMLLVASYVFYGWWNWHLLFLLILLSLTNYLIGIWIDKNESTVGKKILLISGLIINLGVLGIFKYFNFFIDSFIDLVNLSGYNLTKSTTTIILPLGISFYVFLCLSYIIDIYNKNLTANKNIVEVLLSLGFFPIILAGPIQRPSSMLQQIINRRVFDYDQISNGLRQILWGLFAKVVIADNAGIYVDNIFRNFSEYSGITLLLGAVLYAIQIYSDFSGYSNIAIGTGKLFGFDLMKNFSYPYFSRDISEFWKRWHISLTTWLRDYIFLPISFKLASKVSVERVFLIKTDLYIYIIASLITWGLTGLWHGAKYTFIIWGLIHGSFLIIYQWQKKPRKIFFKRLGIDNNSYLIVILEATLTLSIILIAWVIFRSENIENAYIYLSNIFVKDFFTLNKLLKSYNYFDFYFALLLIAVFILLEWNMRNKLSVFPLTKLSAFNWFIYLLLFSVILLFGGSNTGFIYFQF